MSTHQPSVNLNIEQVRPAGAVAVDAEVGEAVEEVVYGGKEQIIEFIIQIKLV